jgi:hypothetical protein
LVVTKNIRAELGMASGLAWREGLAITRG